MHGDLSNITASDLAPVWARQEITVDTIATALGVLPRDLRSHAKNLGMPRRSRKDQLTRIIDDNTFTRMWAAGVYSSEMQNYFGYKSNDSIRRRRARLGLTPRPPGLVKSGERTTLREFLMLQKHEGKAAVTDRPARTCRWCGADISHMRWFAKFCRTKCKAMYNNKKAQLSKDTGFQSKYLFGPFEGRTCPVCSIRFEAVDPRMIYCGHKGTCAVYAYNNRPKTKVKQQAYNRANRDKSLGFKRNRAAARAISAILLPTTKPSEE